ncbi:uncharacterized protein LOC114363484 isoform X1 [Ostrinia furnacalis]|uniref:uncharacterized protein LOC114363484 isoform X1 n=1 Tax=Ostrinia furnacalis TaxID=93504 RepID=UPI00103995F8|nr:uncharacterized protein LOC114363484 isoform X1 [Ostrinia furnacalis]
MPLHFPDKGNNRTKKAVSVKKSKQTSCFLRRRPNFIVRMAAATLVSKKAVKKGKIKKTLKNVLCRPDPVFWPLISDEQKKILEVIMNNHKIDIPKWNKPLWKDIKVIPKDKRPKPPKTQKPDGLLFGISECTNAIHNHNCAAILVDSAVNPRTIVQPVIETCTNANIPVICINDLKALCTCNFGIPTSCLGIKNNCLPDLNKKVLEIASSFKLPEQIKSNEPVESMDTSNAIEEKTADTPTQCPYLYRNNKKTRVFIPSEGIVSKNVKDFSGQDFIKFAAKMETQNKDRKSYMNMVLKKLTNNPNRVQVKQKDFK